MNLFNNFPNSAMQARREELDRMEKERKDSMNEMYRQQRDLTNNYNQQKQIQLLSDHL